MTRVSQLLQGREGGAPSVWVPLLAWGFLSLDLLARRSAAEKPIMPPPAGGFGRGDAAPPRPCVSPPAFCSAFCPGPHWRRHEVQARVVRTTSLWAITTGGGTVGVQGAEGVRVGLWGRG